MIRGSNKVIQAMIFVAKAVIKNRIRNEVGNKKNGSRN